MAADMRDKAPRQATGGGEEARQNQRGRRKTGNSADEEEPEEQFNRLAAQKRIVLRGGSRPGGEMKLESLPGQDGMQ